ncbi:hypothetical protein TYRP_012389 [Tyrophagus putrescentiae]|nr:hypothetical protein TYRP_012389 [Tyrophagus putrescentiae]
MVRRSQRCATGDMQSSTSTLTALRISFKCGKTRKMKMEGKKLLKYDEGWMLRVPDLLQSGQSGKTPRNKQRRTHPAEMHRDK